MRCSNSSESPRSMTKGFMPWPGTPGESTRPPCRPRHVGVLALRVDDVGPHAPAQPPQHAQLGGEGFCRSRTGPAQRCWRSGGCRRRGRRRWGRRPAGRCRRGCRSWCPGPAARRGKVSPATTCPGSATPPRRSGPGAGWTGSPSRCRKARLSSLPRVAAKWARAFWVRSLRVAWSAAWSVTDREAWNSLSLPRWTSSLSLLTSSRAISASGDMERPRLKDSDCADSNRTFCHSRVRAACSAGIAPRWTDRSMGAPAAISPCRKPGARLRGHLPRCRERVR